MMAGDGSSLLHRLLLPVILQIGRVGCDRRQLVEWPARGLNERAVTAVENQSMTRKLARRAPGQPPVSPQMPVEAPPQSHVPVDIPMPAPNVYADGAIGIFSSAQGMIKFDLFEDRLDLNPPNKRGRFITARVTMPRSAAAELARWLAEQIALTARPGRAEKAN